MSIHSIDDYEQFNLSTDPGDLIVLYYDLPISLDSLCDLIQKQIAHLMMNPDQNVTKLQRLQIMNHELQGLESTWPLFERTIYS